MSDIFDWDDEEEERKAEDEVWGAYPLAQPPEVPASSPEPPPTALVPTQPQPATDPWNEVDTVMRPRPEPEPQQGAWSGYSKNTYDQPQQDSWGQYSQNPYDQPAQPGVWSEYRNESPEETARKGGLAWSAGIVFFSSVAFMLFLGWIFDYLFASSPWGLIAGIVLGSVVGFVQFFRISSRIFDPKKASVAERPLMPPDEH
jgi:F0F1-type ATP synthase assembly protein I